MTPDLKRICLSLLTAALLALLHGQREMRGRKPYVEYCPAGREMALV